MNKSSLKMLSYIAEAGGFGQGSEPFGPPSPVVSAMQDKAAEKQKKRKEESGEVDEGPMKAGEGPAKSTLIDPSVMGKEGYGKLPVGIAALTTGPYRAMVGAGGVAGALIGRGLADVISAPEKAKEEVRRQQTAVRSMTNVDNYYKNLGVKTPSMHPKDDLLTTIKNILIRV